MPLNPVLLINLSANDGGAQKRWTRIEKDILSKLPADLEVCKYHTPFDVIEPLKNWLEHGVNCFIIGGGDGSINFILNQLASLVGEDLDQYCIGSIGLGSSNDFHKPGKLRIKGTPIKIDLESQQVVDIGRIDYLDTSNNKSSKLFIINSSVGVTAEANWLFNRGDRIINYLKSKSTNLTILYTAVKGILRFRNIDGVLRFGKTDSKIKLSNLAILKKPHVSGSFSFDQEIQINDSRLGLNACIDMNKLELLRTLFDLSRGRFSGKKKRVSSFVKSAEFFPEEHVALETDGEVVLAKNIIFTVVPNAIKILTT